MSGFAEANYNQGDAKADSDKHSEAITDPVSVRELGPPRG